MDTITHDVRVLDDDAHPVKGCAIRNIKVPEGKPIEMVYITGGSFYGTDRGISNHFHWQKIRRDGTLGPEKNGYWKKE